jgi:hypothetical protein
MLVVVMELTLSVTSRPLVLMVLLGQSVPPLLLLKVLELMAVMLGATSKPNGVTKLSLKGLLLLVLVVYVQLAPTLVATLLLVLMLALVTLQSMIRWRR